MTEETTNYRLLPWDGEAHATEGVPWHLHRWIPNVKQGAFQLLDAKIYRDSVSRQWVREDYANQLSGSDIHIFEKPDIEQIFTISATEEVSLLEAVRQYVGEDRFSKHWVDSVEAAPKFYADPRYAVEKKRGPGRPKKVTQEV